MLSVIMVYGATGNGKSSLIKLFCGKNIKKEIVSHETESKTKETEMYEETLSNGKVRLFVDTMGTNDSEALMSNVDVLRKVMTQLSQKSPNGINIKVIWLVKKDCRVNSDFQTEAKFINSLSEFSNNNIWNSTLILIRDSRLNPPEKHKSGALTAAIKNKGHSKISCMGYNCIELMSEDEKDFFDELKDETRIKMGYLFEKELKLNINNILNNKSFIFVKFNTQKCSNCGIIGDKRFITNKCHTQMTFIHKNNHELIHTSNIKFRHKNKDISLRHPTCIVESYHESSDISERHQSGTYWIHDKGVSSKHVGYISSRHKNSYVKASHGNTSRYHPKGTFKFKVSGTSTGARVASGIFTLGISAIWQRKEKFLLQYICCRKPSGSVGCLFRCDDCYGDPFLDGCHRSYSCCNESESSSGCETYYSCCDSSINSTLGKEGCTQYYPCCGETVSSYKGSRGCNELYGCCNEASNSIGCESYHTCCETTEGTKGCKERWNCGSNISSKGCESYHPCCDTTEGTKGCEGYYECCGDLSINDNPCSFSCCNEKIINENNKGCVKICGLCKEEWGTGNGGGCIENDKHKMVNV